MSKPNWTPGPWEFCPGEFNYDHEDIRGCVGSVCSVTADRYVAKIEDGLTKRDQEVANARLIAAAPDLYEALLAFMDMWNSGDGGRSSKRAQQKRADMWTKANAAVAKANGQQV